MSININLELKIVIMLSSFNFYMSFLELTLNRALFLNGMGVYLPPQILRVLRLTFIMLLKFWRARSSVVEQHPFKVKVGGSSPPALTKKPLSC